ncbi:MAG: biotin/lipoate A/B protein ligase family protein [Candidatus Tectimicrobiota bacterium]
MHSDWRFVDTGAADAAMNMALDEALLLRHEAGACPPTLRVYRWQQPTLSLGYAQHARQEVDLAACAARGVGVMRRPTGGRAVLHDQDVTYSVVMPIALEHGPGSVTEHYRRLGLALEAACRLLDLPVHLARPPRRPPAARALSSPACFAALSRYELSVGGKKLVGSAQKRARVALLQHGSIPLRLDRQLLFDCLSVPAAQRAALVEEAYRTMTAVHEVAAAPVSVAALQAALRQGCQVVFGVALREAPITPAEWCLARQLYTTKYATASWTLEGAAVWQQQQRDSVAQLRS